MHVFARVLDCRGPTMRALGWFILGCAVAGCSETSAVDAGAPGGGGAATRGGSAAAPPAGAGGVGGLGGVAGAAGVSALAGAAGAAACPADLPSPYGAVPCATEGLICEYSFPLACPVGCSGGDYQSVQCANGIWVDYRHSVGAPTCRCSPLSFPAGMQERDTGLSAGLPLAHHPGVGFRGAARGVQVS